MSSSDKREAHKRYNKSPRGRARSKRYVAGPEVYKRKLERQRAEYSRKRSLGICGSTGCKEMTDGRAFCPDHSRYLSVMRADLFWRKGR